jgi:ketosteroid isomerase-like protein
MTNLEIIRSTYEGSTSEENGQALKKYLAPKARWTEAAGFPYAGTYIGYDAIAAGVFYRLATEWENYHIEIEGYAENSDTVIAYGTYKGIYKATGKPFQARVAHVWNLSDGLIVSFEQIVDTVPVKNALTRA